MNRPRQHTQVARRSRAAPLAGWAALLLAALGTAWRFASGSRSRSRNVDLESVAIHAASLADLPALEGLFPCTSTSGLPAIQAAVREGHVTVTTAWLSGKPAGIALIAWNGPRAAEVRVHWPQCPEIYCVEVLEPIRREGIGSRLVAFCEDLAAQRRFATVGVAVALDNVDAYALYIRLGYAERERIDYPSPVPGKGTAHEPAPMRFFIKPLPVR